MMSEYDHLLATAPRDMQLGKCPKGFELRMIKISSESSDGPYKVDVLVFSFDGLAIHKAPWGWHITHIRSGKLLTHTDTKRQVVKAVKTLAKAFNWHLAESTLRKRHKECKAAVRAVRDA